MDANLLKYLAFVRTVEYGSFTRAAEALDYSQSAVSRMIRDLEQECGLRLLERGRAGVRLTSDGTRLLPYARSLCAQYQSFQTQVDELTGLQSGLIRIGTISSVATHWLPKIIQRFRADYPKIDYELVLGHYAEIEQWITDGRVDCGFLRLPVKAGFDTIALEEDPLFAVLPEQHALAKLDRVPLHALCDAPFLLLEKSEKAEISELFDRYDLHPHVQLRTVDDYAVMSMVESGLGLSILPGLILRRIPYHIAIRPLDVPASRTLGLAMRSRQTASLAVKRFLEYLPYRNGPKGDCSFDR